MASHVCDRNHVGSPGSMEQNAAVMMVKRSEDLHRMQYRSVLCDGDTNTITEINAAAPYPKPVSKKECVNHVA